MSFIVLLNACVIPEKEIKSYTNVVYKNETLSNQMYRHKNLHYQLKRRLTEESSYLLHCSKFIWNALHLAKI